MKAHSVCLANQKGGVGKTTTVINLGVCLGQHGYKVLIVDNDPQGNATSGLGRRGEVCHGALYEVLAGRVPIRRACRDTDFDGVALLPSSPDLAGLESEWNQSQSGGPRALQQVLAECQDAYHYILIDNPPSLGLLSICGITAARSLVIPVQCEYFALEGLSAILDSVQRVRQALNTDLVLAGFLLTLYDGRTRLSREVAAEVRRHFPTETFTTIIPRSVRVAEAPSHGLPVVLYDPHCAGAAAYRIWTQEFLDRQSQRAGAGCSVVPTPARARSDR